MTPVTPVTPLRRVQAARRRLATEGPPRTRDRKADFETISLPVRDCDLLRDLLIAESAGVVVEIGLAYGSSALAIGEALVMAGRPDPRQIVIDPFQESVWTNAGWELMCDAGLDAIATLLPATSSIALPQLLAEGLTADAAFVDGSHRFHEVFVDLYFLRHIVRPGGLIIVDDNWANSVRTAVNYYQQNLGWQPVSGGFAAGTVVPVQAEPGAAPVTRCLALRLPDPATEPPFEEFQPF